MQDAPQVSVVMATYNRSTYLREAIASALAQTFQPFELIIVDDGSADDTAAVVASFDDPRIRYTYQDNAGQSAALNCGLAQARGGYIAFLDDDDRFLSHNLTTQISFLEANPDIGLVGGNVALIAADGTYLQDREGWSEPRELTWPACLYACPLVPSAVVLHSRWLERLEAWFDPALLRFQDVDFWTRLHLAGCRMRWNPEVVSVYRQHPGQMRHDAERYYRSHLQVLDKLYAQPSVSSVLHAERPALYMHFHLLGACHAFAACDFGAGQQRLRLAMDANPDLEQSAPAAIAVALADIARNVAGDNALTLIDMIFDTLPPDMARWHSWRRYALSALHMQRVFATRVGGTSPRLSDWVRGVYWNPRWLANRGVWSILVRDLVLRGVISGARR